MKFISKLPFKFPAMILLLGLSLAFVQCTKDPTQGEIKVVNFTTGAAVAGATVKLTTSADTSSSTGFFICNGGFVPENEYVTNGSGLVTECFELPALLTVTVTYTDGNGLTYAGAGKLNLVEHETTSVTVKLNN